MIDVRQRLQLPSGKAADYYSLPQPGRLAWGTSRARP
jgi:hypothetical protein